MRLVAATVRNYRLHHEVRVDFDPQRTVIGGPNEAGKSTLVEAIHRALFFRFKSTVGLERIRPRHHSGAPEVIVEFEVAGSAWTLRKVFKGAQGSTATLVRAACGTRHDGDEAEERLRRLLGVDDDATARPAELWSHLWVWQGTAGEDPTVAGTLGRAAGDLQRRLGSLAGGTTAQTDLDDRVLCRIVAEDAATYGERGVKKGSALNEARVALDEARGDAERMRAQLDGLRAAADAILDGEAAIQAAREVRRAAEEELGRVDATLQRIAALETALGREQAAERDAAARYDLLAQGDEQIRDIETKIATLAREIEPQERALAAARDRLRDVQARLPAAAADVARAITEQQAAAEEVQLLGRIAEAATLHRHRVELVAAADRIRALRTAILHLDRDLRDLPPIDAAIVTRLEGLERDLGSKRGAMRAIATGVEVIDAAAGLTIDGRRVGAGETATLLEPTEIALGPGTLLRVTPGGGRSLADLRIEVARLEADLAKHLAPLGLGDAAAAGRALAERVAAESKQREHRAAIEGLGGDEVEGRLEKLDAEIASIEAEIARRAPAGFLRPADDAALAAARAAADGRSDTAAGCLEDARHADAALRKESEALAEEQRTLEDGLAQQRRQIDEQKGRRTTLEEQHGTDRRDELERRADAKRMAAQAVVETQRALAGLRPDGVRADQERCQRSAREARNEIDAATQRQAEARGRLLQAGVGDLHEAKAMAEARLEIAGRRHAEIERRARAVHLLRERFERRRDTLAERFAEPLRERIGDYLEALYGPGSRATVSVGGGRIADLTVARTSIGGMAFEFGSLSGGTREQVATACRLAMAEILATDDGADGCLPVILDDAFVNTDPERLRGVQRVLDLGARRGLQIIVLSCSPADYGLLGARLVRLAPPRLGDAAVERSAGPPVAASAAASPEAPAATGGGRPVGERDLEGMFLAALDAMPGRRSGNKSLRERLGWDEATYDRIRDGLAAAGHVERGQGRGGSVRRPEAPPD